MTLDERMREALACFNALRVLGFESKDIYLVTLPKQGVWGLGLRAQGIDYCIPCGTADEPPEEVRRAWLAGCERLGTDQAWGDEVWNNSQVKREPVAFLESLVRAGFRIPHEGTPPDIGGSSVA